MKSKRKYYSEKLLVTPQKTWRIMKELFSKILERLMYNRLYKHLSNLKILYSKQFRFQKDHSTDHTLLQLVDQIYELFELNEYTIGIFIDLSKAFDTVDHNLLLKKLEIYTVYLPRIFSGSEIT